MKLRRAVVTAAGRDGQQLPLQRLIDRDGSPKTALQIVVEEAVPAGADEIAIVVRPGDESAFWAAAGGSASRLELLPQSEPLGYGHAIQTARGFVGDEPFLHFVGDHLYVSDSSRRCAEQLVAIAEAEDCCVSAVQATRESMLPYFGTVGGRRVPDARGLYEVETVVEKPTPTLAEQDLIVPGLRAGHYLCFFGPQQNLRVQTACSHGLCPEVVKACKSLAVPNGGVCVASRAGFWLAVSEPPSA